MNGNQTNHFPIQSAGVVIAMLRGRHTSWYAIKSYLTGKQEEST
jgi:hypothetical protein